MDAAAEEQGEQPPSEPPAADEGSGAASAADLVLGSPMSVGDAALPGAISFDARSIDEDSALPAHSNSVGVLGGGSTSGIEASEAVTAAESSQESLPGPLAEAPPPEPSPAAGEAPPPAADEAPPRPAEDEEPPAEAAAAAADAAAPPELGGVGPSEPLPPPPPPEELPEESPPETAEADGAGSAPPGLDGEALSEAAAAPAEEPPAETASAAGAGPAPPGLGVEVPGEAAAALAEEAPLEPLAAAADAAVAASREEPAAAFLDAEEAPPEPVAAATDAAVAASPEEPAAAFLDAEEGAAAVGEPSPRGDAADMPPEPHLPVRTPPGLSNEADETEEEDEVSGGSPPEPEVPAGQGEEGGRAPPAPAEDRAARRGPPAVDAWGLQAEGCVAAPSGLDGEVLSLEALQAAALAGAGATSATGDAGGPLVRELGASSDSAVPGASAEDAGSDAVELSSLPGVVTNALFVCYVDACGTAVQVVAQASMQPVARVTSGDARVIDLALQAEESHLLVAFDNGRVIVFRLSADSAAPRVLLKFDGPPARGVLWHPTNPRVFLTLHPQRVLLWHLQLIVQFSTMQLAGYEPLEEEGVQTSLQVTAELAENASSEALPQLPLAGSPCTGAKRLHELLQGTGGTASESPRTTTAPSPLATEEMGGKMCCAAFSPDGEYLVASTDRVVWLWRLTSKDEQTAPRAACVQRHELPEGRDGNIERMRLVPWCLDADASCYILLAITATEVLFWTLDPRPCGGTGYWLPCGRLLCPVQQRLRFPGRVSADVFQPWSPDEWPRATLLVALEPNEAGGAPSEPLLLAGELTHVARGQGRKPVVKALSVLRPPLLPVGGGSWRLASVRAFERSTRARALPEGAEAHAWALVALAVDASGTTRCRCLALPWRPQSAVAADGGGGGGELAPALAVDELEEQAAELSFASPGGLPREHSETLAVPPAEASDGEEPPPGLAAPLKAGGAEAERGASPPEEREVPEAEDEDPGPAPADAGQSGGGHGQKRQSQDTDPLTPAMVRSLAAYMEKQAAKASQSMVESISRKLPSRVSGQGSRRRSSSQRHGGSREPQSEPPEGSLEDTLRSLIDESTQLVEQVARGEKQVTQAMKKIADPEAAKAAAGNKPAKDVVERELARFRDGTLPKAVLKAAEGRAFADRFSDGLRAGRPETAPLLEALQPSKQQLLEALKADLGQWCTGAVAKRCKSALQDIGLPQASRALEAAMKEVASQSGHALDRILLETRAKADAKRLSEVCCADVRAAVRKEVQTWEEEFLWTTRQPVAVAPADRRAVREGFTRRLRAAVAPLQRELDGAARDLELAGSSLRRCKAHADGFEAAGSSRASASGGRGRSLSEERAEILDALAAGRLREALERALKWDAQNKGSTTSLVEHVCRCLSGSADEGGEEPVEPEEFLARPEVAAQMDSRLKLLVTHALLQRAVLCDAPLDGIEANLEWAFGFLQAVDTDAEGEQASSVSSSFEAVRPGVQEALDVLRKGEQPPALAEATAGKRRQLAGTARLALKTLDALARLRPRA